MTFIPYEKITMTPIEFCPIHNLLYQEEVDRWTSIINRPDVDTLLDDGILPLLKALNVIPGCVTRWSCTGHPEQKKPRGYVMLMTRSQRYDDIFASLTDIVDRLNTTLRTDGFPHASGLGLTRTYRQVGKGPDGEVCLVMILGWYVANDNAKHTLLTSLTQLIHDTYTREG